MEKLSYKIIETREEIWDLISKGNNLNIAILDEDPDFEKSIRFSSSCTVGKINKYVDNFEKFGTVIFIYVENEKPNDYEEEETN